MASNSPNTVFNISKKNAMNNKEQSSLELIDILLDENNLARKHHSKTPNSLVKAASDCLELSPQNSESLQEAILSHLENLITDKKVPRRLKKLLNNSILLKDYLLNPQLSGFEKVNLELISSLFQVKVVIYSMTEDQYLVATIINERYEKTIRLLRNKNNYYNPVYPKSEIENFDLCKNIVLDVAEETIINIKENTSPVNQNGTNFANAEYQTSTETNSTEDSPEQIRTRSTRHKKSLSDSFNHKNGMFEQQEHEVYNMFNSATPPEDFFKKLEVRKERTDSNFELRANLDFIEEILHEEPQEVSKARYAIKNYPIASSGLSSGAGSLVDLERPAFRMNQFRGHNDQDMLFNENFSLLEMEKFEERNNQLNKLKNKTFTKGQLQTQATPYNGYTPQPFNFADGSHMKGGNLFHGINPTGRKEDQRQNMSGRGFAFPGQENQTQVHYGQQNIHDGAVNSRKQAPQLKKTQSMRPDIKPNQQQQQAGLFMEGYGFNQLLLGSLTPEQIAMYQGFGTSQQSKEKGPMNVDDPKRRYTGKLKFFDETKNYGFIIMDDDGSDIFVHFDDLAKAHISKDFLRCIKGGKTIRLSFCCMQYFGKYNKSRKATDIEFLG